MRTEAVANLRPVGESNLAQCSLLDNYSIISICREHELETMRVRSKEMQERVSACLCADFQLPKSFIFSGFNVLWIHPSFNS